MMKTITISSLAISLLTSGCGSPHSDPATPSPVRHSDSRRAPATQPQAATRIAGPPKVTFAGTTVAAARVVFCCDASGSMLLKFDTLRQALRTSIAAMTPDQSFDLLFFTDEGPRRFGRSLVPATDDNKRRADEFLNETSPHGSADPLEGLRAAFAAAPETIFLLTDGDFPDNAAVLREIRTLNAGRRVTVHTIAYDDHGKDNGETYEELLQQVASENRGLYRFVSEADLGKK
jgi:uncharacterized protein with von Willebrand factor type A (vWA) domain